MNPLHLLESATRGAVANARRAVEEVAAAVDERRRVVQALDAGEAPGDLARLTVIECRDLLATKALGRLAYVARAGMPDIVPVNYVMDGTSVLIRSAPGPKLQAAERRELVAFEVDDIDEHARTGWSVVVIGTARRLTPEEAQRHPAPEPWASGPRLHTLRIEPRRIDGRRLL